MKKLALLLLAAAMVYSSFGQKKEALELTVVDVIMTEDSLRFNLQFKNVGDSAMLVYRPWGGNICASLIAISFYNEQGVQVPYENHRYWPCAYMDDSNSDTDSLELVHIDQLAAIIVDECNSVCLNPGDSFIQYHHFRSRGFGALLKKKSPKTSMVLGLFLEDEYFIDEHEQPYKGVYQKDIVAKQVPVQWGGALK